MVVKRFSGGKDPLEWVQGIKARIDAGVAESLERAVIEGDFVMTENIGSRPTAWMAKNRGKTGRVETGHMRDSVGFRIDSNGGGKGSAAFGWVGDKQPYFITQEEGGKNSFTGGSIEAMYAKADAAAYAWDLWKHDVKKVVDGA